MRRPRSSVPASPAGTKVGRTKWSRQNEVIVADPGRELAWRTVPSRLYNDSTEWHIALEPVDGGTRIVQSFRVVRLGAVMDRVLYALVKEHRDRSAKLTADVTRLGEVAASAQSEVERQHSS